MIPRVTEILRPFTSFDHVPKDVLEHAAARGTTVHAICAGISKGDWISNGMIDMELRPYIDSFRLWMETEVKTFHIVEQRFVHEEFEYTGQVDSVIETMDGKMYLVDLKTSARPQKTYPVQMGAYEMLLKFHGIEVEGAMIVYLSRDGEYPKVVTLDDLETERQIFLYSLECWYYFHGDKS